MKDLFPQYYSAASKKPSNTDELWQKGLFVFDTHVLLNVYSYASATRSKWLDTLERVQTQLWSPYQFMADYHLLLEGRRNKIEREAADAVLAPIREAREKLQAGLSDKTEHPLSDSKDVREVAEALLKQVSTSLAEAERKVNEWKKNHATTWTAALSKIGDLFGGRVGRQYTHAETVERCVEAKARYMTQRPPGFKDFTKVGKEGNPYGDALAWFQIIEQAQASRKPIVVVTADSKVDWWTDKGLPRHELAQELMEKAGVEFKLMKPDDYLSWAGKMLQQEIDEEVLQETRTVTKKETPAPVRLPSIPLSGLVDAVTRTNALYAMQPTLQQLALGIPSHWTLTPEFLEHVRRLESIYENDGTAAFMREMAAAQKYGQIVLQATDPAMNNFSPSAAEQLAQQALQPLQPPLVQGQIIGEKPPKEPPSKS